MAQPHALLLVLVPHLLAAGLLASRSEAAVTLGAVRTELLYSQDADPDCSELHAIEDDAALPFNVARLRATVTGANPGTPVSFRWALVDGSAGLLAADQDLGPAGETPAVSGMCAEFGNACLLTKENIRFYNEPTCFFVAPTCDVLPKNTTRAFRGGTSKVRVKAKAGKRKLGKATLTIGWGRDGAIILSAQNVNGVFEDGIGKQNGVNVYAVVPLGATISPEPSPAPGPVRSFFFDGDGITPGDVPPGCSFGNFDACAELDLFAPGTYFPTVEARYEDGSALCDKLKVRTGPCAADPKLEIIPKPQRDTYDPGTIDLTVRLHNASKPEGNLPPCNFLLRGANVLTCTAQIKVGGIEQTDSTQFDLPHCSVTTSQSCTSDAECSTSVCGECQANEVCLSQSHCSVTLSQPCTSSIDCDPTGSSPTCPNCREDETCVRVLALGASEVTIAPGESVDLLDETVQLRNALPDTAKIRDKWTATVFIPDVSDSETLRYKIRGRPPQ